MDPIRAEQGHVGLSAHLHRDGISIISPPPFPGSQARFLQLELNPAPLFPVSTYLSLPCLAQQLSIRKCGIQSTIGELALLLPLRSRIAVHFGLHELAVIR
ncbi:hypothetical protein FALCPG4_009250 [Fusarium falciforme]